MSKSINKMHLEKRFGTSAGCMTLVLRNANNENIAIMNDDYAKIGAYGLDDDYVIHCIDEDPNSILRQIEEAEGVEKYVMTDADYDKLPSSIKSECQKV